MWKFNRRPNFPIVESPNVPKFEVWIEHRHDNREVTLTHLSQAQNLRSDIGHRINPHERVNESTFFHANCSVRSMSCILGNSSSFQAAYDDQFNPGISFL